MRIFSQKQNYYMCFKTPKEGSLIQLGPNLGYTICTENSEEYFYFKDDQYIFAEVLSIGKLFTTLKVMNEKTYETKIFQISNSELRERSDRNILALHVVLFVPFVVYNLFTGFYFRKNYND